LSRDHAAIGEFVDWKSGFEIEFGGVGHFFSLRRVGALLNPWKTLGFLLLSE